MYCIASGEVGTVEEKKMDESTIENRSLKEFFKIFNGDDELKIIELGDG